MSAAIGGVTVVCPDVSANCLGRALVLADVLGTDGMDVRIVGPQLGRGVWPPYRGAAVPLRSYPMTHVGDYPAYVRWLRSELEGRRVIVSKPRPTSLGVTLATGRSPSQFLLDVDDWEIGLRHAGGPLSRRLYSLATRLSDWAHPGKFNGYPAMRACDLLARRAPHGLASNRFLQRRYGGEILPHVRDPARLDPARSDRAGIRRRHGLEGRTWVGFVGSPTPHKGVEDLISALARAGSEAGLFLAGLDPRRPFHVQLADRACATLGSERVRIVEAFPLDQVPEMTVAPDIICLPSRDEPSARGQMPAKVYDAMMMERAIVATATSDLPEVLEGCGVVVRPGDSDGLVDALEALAADEVRRVELGRAARRRAVERYSYEAGRAVLLDALSRVSPAP